MKNPSRGLHYVALDLSKAKLTVFVDGSFANNRDLSSQIGFLIAVVNETKGSDETYNLRGNIIH